MRRRIKPYKKVDKIYLYLADCITAMNVILSTESVDVVVTSPPYNIGVDYHTYDDSLPRENYLRWIRDVCAAIRRILKPSSKYMEGFPRRLLFYASDAILLLHNVSSGVIV